MRRVESDVCIIGGGISAALLAQKLAQERPGLDIAVVEAGAKIADFENRAAYRQRWLEYGENPWPGDFVRDQEAQGVISRTMALGGSALHWGGVTNRFSEEDLRLRSLYGLAVDWPLDWDDLERHYVEAEKCLGVSGEPSPCPEDRRSAPYPMPPMPLSHNLKVLQGWAEKSGLPFGGTPQAKNTREYDGRGICRAVQHVRDLPHGGTLLARLHLRAPPRGEEDSALRRDPGATPRAPRREAHGGERGGRRPQASGPDPVVRRACVRPRLGLRVVVAPPPAVGPASLPERPRQLLGPRGPLLPAMRSWAPRSTSTCGSIRA